MRGFGLLHERSMILGNDGKEVRGQDKLTPRGRKKIKADVPYAIRFHLAPGVEATSTADGMGAILRAPGAPPWNFRCRGAMLGIEESLYIDHRGQPPSRPSNWWWSAKSRRSAGPSPGNSAAPAKGSP